MTTDEFIEHPSFSQMKNHETTGKIPATLESK
jgi:hypothetical protein